MVIFGFLQQRIQTIETLKIQEKSLSMMSYAMIFGGFSVLFEVAAIQNLNISHFIIIYCIKPILSSFVNFFLDGHSITRLEILSLLSCFTGVMILTRPDWTPSPYNLASITEYRQDLFGITLSLISVLSGGIHHGLIRKSGYKIHNTHYMLVIGIFTIITASLSIPIFGFSITPLNNKIQLVGLTIIGITTYASQYWIDMSQ